MAGYIRLRVGIINNYYDSQIMQTDSGVVPMYVDLCTFL